MSHNSSHGGPGEELAQLLRHPSPRVRALAPRLVAAALVASLMTNCGSDTSPAAPSKAPANVVKSSARLTPAQVPTPANVPFTGQQEAEAYKRAYKEAYAAAYNMEGSADPMLRQLTDSPLRKAMMSGRNAGLQAGKAARTPAKRKTGR